MNAYTILSVFLKEQEISYSKASVSKEVDGNKEHETKTNFSGNMVGLADKKHFTEQDADPNELAMGIEVEKEHTEDPTIAKKITLDHLAEHPKYYTYLKRMEQDATVHGE